jgi:signal transduction histidine kinase
MSPRQKARLIFSLALLLLISSGIGATVSILGLVNSTHWVTHTYEVKESLSKIESLFALAGRTRASYVAGGDPNARAQCESAIATLQVEIRSVSATVSDNTVQHANAAQLEVLVNRRVEVLTASMNAYAAGKSDPDEQSGYNAQSLELANESAAVLRAMQGEEDRLLTERLQISDRLFKVTVAVLSAMFLSSLILIIVHYRMLTAEGAKREESEENARRVSAQLLRVQDHERRKFSRELHDGLGQTLAVVKWTLSSLLEKHPDDPSIVECVKSVDEAILGTRTISHLLHPPLLDEAGFESAARWFVEGFSQRSGIPVSLTIEDTGRLPRSVELALFRVLQESLTNIHKHSKSPRAEVSLRPAKANVVLRVRDFGDGIPEETLENFVNSGTRVGVGLAGMRERIREQGGQFKINSNGAGTTIEVSLPRAGRPSFESEFTDSSIT